MIETCMRREESIQSFQHFNSFQHSAVKTAGKKYFWAYL